MAPPAGVKPSPLANLKLADGTLSVSAGSPAQYEEIFVAYPKLAALHGNVLAPRTVIAPGHGPITTLAQERKHNPFFAR